MSKTALDSLWFYEISYGVKFLTPRVEVVRRPSYRHWFSYKESTPTSRIAEGTEEQFTFAAIWKREGIEEARRWLAGESSK